MSSAMGDVPGTRRRPWRLRTADGEADFTAWRDPTPRQAALVVKAAGGEIRYNLRCLQDLHDMLLERGDWMPLGCSPEKVRAVDDSVEAWARSADNPVRGWYGLTPGQRGNFALYVPPVMAALDLAAIEPGPRCGRMKAK